MHTLIQEVLSLGHVLIEQNDYSDFFLKKNKTCCFTYDR